MNSSQDRQIIVGIGASAGGLEAISELVRNLPATTGLTFVVAQHLSPVYKSMLNNLISRETSRPVREVESGAQLEPNTIYITPSNNHVRVKNNTLILETPESGPGPKPSINLLFRSMAQELQERAIGIILSGTGTDGSEGIKEVKKNGGFTMVQSPETARYDSMPIAALNTGSVDLIESPSRMGLRILEFLENPDAFKAAPHSRTHQGNILGDILYRLFVARGVNFSNYKKTTMERRVEKRIASLRLNSPAEYLDYMERNSDEAQNLYQDVLIGVTSFFRDREAFDALSKYLAQALQETKQGDSFRAWVAGSSTGEEVYSIAILIMEHLRELDHTPEIQIFATDIDEHAIAQARKAVYPETSIENMDQEILRRYFVPVKGGYRLIKSITDVVIFSQHNVAGDPPFLRMDLISCRNLLIYFNAELQDQVMKIFQYSLKQGGLLFLGKSETVGNIVSAFKIEDKKAQIYRSLESPGRKPPIFRHQTYQLPPKKGEEIKKTSNRYSLDNLVDESISTMVFDRVAVINESFEIVHIKGKIPYLSIPPGTATLNILQMLSSDLSLELRSALIESKKRKESVKTPIRKVSILETIDRYIQLIVQPLEKVGVSGDLYLVFFYEVPYSTLVSAEPEDENTMSFDSQEQLRVELNRTREHLQTIVEEQETSNEELQSLNEELESSNEELQSSNEELETTNEELQSTNEELQTAYVELKSSYDENSLQKEEIEKLASRFQILHSGMLDGSVLLNEYGQILDCNQSFANMLGYKRSDLLGISYISIVAEEYRSSEMAISPSEILKIGHSNLLEKELIHQNGSRVMVEFRRHGKPGSENSGHFIWEIVKDITKRKLIEAELAEYRLSLEKKLEAQIGEIKEGEVKFRSVFEQAAVGMARLSPEGRFIEVNQVLCELLEYTCEEFTHLSLRDINLPKNRGSDEEPLKQLLAGDSNQYNTEKNFITKSGDSLWLSQTVSLVRAEDNTPQYFIAIFVNITRQVNTESQIQMREQMMIQQSRMASMGEMVGAIAHQWRQPLNILSLIIYDTLDAHKQGELTDDFLQKNYTEILDQLNFMSRTIDDFRSFYKPNESLDTFDIREMLNETVTILDAQLKTNNIKVTIEKTGRFPSEIKLYKNHLKQSLINVISTAIDSIQAKRIEMTHPELQGQITIRILTRKNCLGLRIIDNGKKLTKKNLERFFEPFFFTSLENREKAPGLYMTKLIVEKYIFGKIDVESLSDGTEILIQIPLPAEEVADSGE